jgi:putative ABC transport system substrate-binding protein
MKRRHFTGRIAAVLVGASTIVKAQTTPRLPVVGTLSPYPSANGRNIRFLLQGMSEFGYLEGKNFRFEHRFAPGNPDAFPALAADLVKINVDVIYAVGPAATTAAWSATRVLPIVAIDLETDPVQAGWARSLARPAGNLTGLFLDLPGVAGKWLELLRSAAPEIRRVGLLWDATTGPAQLAAAKAAAQSFNMSHQVLELHPRAGVHAALQSATGTDIDGLVVLGSPELSAPVPAKEIADFAMHHRLPAISSYEGYTRAGGLMSLGLNQAQSQPRTGVFVAKILNGANAGDLSIELPAKFDLIINLKAAQALGIKIPQSLLLRADELIR